MFKNFKHVIGRKGEAYGVEQSNFTLHKGCKVKFLTGPLAARNPPGEQISLARRTTQKFHSPWQLQCEIIQFRIVSIFFNFLFSFRSFNEL